MRERDVRRQLFLIGCAVLALTILTEARQSSPKRYRLEAITGLGRDLVAQPATLQGKKCVRITSSGVEQVADIDGQEFDPPRHRGTDRRSTGIRYLRRGSWLRRDRLPRLS